MLVFIRHGDYDRRLYIEGCFNKYMDFLEKSGDYKLVVANGKNNKPYFKDYPEIRFSVSHSGDLALLAIGNTEIGIDIEKIRELDYNALAKRYYTDGEVAQINSLDDYFKVWTRKEAFLKLSAEGLSGLTKCDTSKPLTFEGDNITFKNVDIFEGYVCTIAAPEQEILFMDYND